MNLRQLYDVYLGLSELDRDEAIKLSPDVRLKVAINLNKISGQAAAYERTRARTLADLQKANREIEPRAQRTVAEIEADFIDKMTEIGGEAAENIDLKSLAKAELQLENNPRLGSNTLVLLFPILRDVD